MGELGSYTRAIQNAQRKRKIMAINEQGRAQLLDEIVHRRVRWLLAKKRAREILSKTRSSAKEADRERWLTAKRRAIQVCR